MFKIGMFDAAVGKLNQTGLIQFTLPLVQTRKFAKPPTKLPSSITVNVIQGIASLSPTLRR